MYRRGEEITKEVIFTRLLRALNCYDDDDVFDMIEDTEYECDELKYPENSSADYIRYCEAENILDAVAGISDERFRYVEEYTVFDKEKGETIDKSIHPIFDNKAVCICNNYDLISMTEYMNYGEDIEIWMTDKYDFYTVANSYIETGEMIKIHRRILSSVSEDKKIQCSLFDLLYGLQQAQYE